MFCAVIQPKKISKRLPNKNIRLLHGLPLICWTIEESLKSKFLTKICVSSDCKKPLKLHQVTNLLFWLIDQKNYMDQILIIIKW